MAVRRLVVAGHPSVQDLVAKGNPKEQAVGSWLIDSGMNKTLAKLKFEYDAIGSATHPLTIYYVRDVSTAEDANAVFIAVGQICGSRSGKGLENARQPFVRMFQRWKANGQMIYCVITYSATGTITVKFTE